jgi:DamX protein
MSTGMTPSLLGEGETIFEPASWLIKIDFINQFILNNNVLISILGDAGCGKTTFAHLLQEKLESSVCTEIITIQQKMDMGLILDELRYTLDLKEAKSLADIVLAVNQRQSKVLIVLDNAENLQESYLKELLDALKPQEGSGYLHLCLVSDFSLVQVTSRLAREEFKDMIHSIELQPLNESETKAYVLSQIDSTPNKINLSDELLKQFYQLTEGNIISINSQMISFFVDRVENQTALYKRYLPHAMISGLAVTLLGVVFFFVSQSSTNSLLPETLAQNSMDSIQLELPLNSEIPSYQVAAIHQPMEVISLQKAEIQLASVDDSAGLSATQGDDLVVMDKVVPIPNPQALIEEAPKTNEVADDEHVTLEKKPATIPGKEVGKAAPKKTSPALFKKSIKAKHASKPQTKSGYTIQLLASRDKNQLSQLAKRFSGIGQVKIQQFESQGVTWFILTKGDYTQRQQAKNAIQSLPKELSAFKPWVRTMNNLKSVG